ncbi:MAG: alpha/beta hydrolase, partial [Acidobacteriota bacterium]|nr:alpha/beta hydrolase [Blastocatellia bacterium]MDW8241049.1 alpha/beta hydrolase [Acidobacteriota bacterium]
MPYLRVEDGDLYFQCTGQGPPIVFVNDWALSQNYWQPIVQRLSSTYTCVTYDARGFGQSRSFLPAASYTIDHHADDLHRLLVSLRLGLVHLVAHGLGVLASGLSVDRHPQDVQTLSLVAAEAELASDHVLQRRLKYVQALLVLKRMATLPLVRHVVLQRYGLGRLSPAARKMLLRDFSQLDARSAWPMIGSALDEQTFQEAIAGIAEVSVPVLIVAGGQDALAPVDHAQKIFARIQRGRLVTMHACGHFPMLEAPEKFVDVLRHFFEAVGPTASKP